MTRRKGGLGAAVLLGVLLIGTVVAAQEFDLPGFVTAEEEIPALAPDAGQQVAVLEILLQASDDGLVRGELTSQRIIDSFAPKSASRSSGDWEIRIEGETTLVYQIPDPLNLEVENPDDQETPFGSFRLDSLDWTLIVPLYDEGRPLGAETVEITDLVTGATVLRVELESS